MAFSGHKCEHAFTQIESPSIKIDQPNWFSGAHDHMPTWTKWPTGLQEGKELICVKCFHKQKQILDYGKSRYADWESDFDTSVFTKRDTCLSRKDTCGSIQRLSDFIFVGSPAGGHTFYNLDSSGWLILKKNDSLK